MSALKIKLMFRGFEKKIIQQIFEIPRGINSEMFLPVPVQLDRRNGKTSIIIQVFTAGEFKFFPGFIPALMTKEEKKSAEENKPDIDDTASNFRFLTLYNGEEGTAVITEKIGENFQITLLDLWEPTWVSSYFGDRDAIGRCFSGERREYVLSVIAAMEYRAAEKQREEQEREERKHAAAEKDISAAGRIRKLFGLAKKGG